VNNGSVDGAESLSGLIGMNLWALQELPIANIEEDLGSRAELSTIVDNFTFSDLKVRTMAWLEDFRRTSLSRLGW